MNRAAGRFTRTGAMEPAFNAANPVEVHRAKLAYIREPSLAQASPAETATIEAAIRTFETAARTSSLSRFGSCSRRSTAP